MRQGHAQRAQSAADNYTHAIGSQWLERCYPRKEYRLPLRPRPNLPQVTQDGIVDRTAQRVCPRPLGLAVRDVQHLTLPIEVLQPQSRDFPSTEAVDG